jgi:hypothetical protein
MGSTGDAMEYVLLSMLEGHHACVACPPMDLSEIDALALHLQVNAIERSTSKAYVTGAHDYVNFCILHVLPLDPTPSLHCLLIAIHCLRSKISYWGSPLPPGHVS